MHEEISSGACEAYSRCLALNFNSWHNFIRIEFIVVVRNRCGGKYHTNSNEFKMREEMCLGVYEVRSGCFALSFVLCHEFVHIEFIVPIKTRCAGTFHTNSDGFERHAMMF